MYKDKLTAIGTMVVTYGVLNRAWRMIRMSQPTVEIVGEYVIIKKEDKKSVLDADDILNLLHEFSENENKINQLVREYTELKSMMGAK